MRPLPPHVGTSSGQDRLDIGGQTLGIRTSTLEEKATAVDMLGVLCAAMGKYLMPHYPSIIDATLPLLKF